MVCQSLRVAGDEMNECIAAYMRRAYNLLIGERTSEAIKIEIGSAYLLLPEREMAVRGRDLVSGLPHSILVNSGEIREALREPVRQIVETVRSTLESAPPELAADIMERGIALAGGGALLRGLDQLISKEVQTPVHVADDPLLAVAIGTGKAVENWDTNWGRSSSEYNSR